MIRELDLESLQILKKTTLYIIFAICIFKNCNYKASVLKKSHRENWWFFIFTNNYCDVGKSMNVNKMLIESSRDILIIALIINYKYKSNS